MTRLTHSLSLLSAGFWLGACGQSGTPVNTEAPIQVIPSQEQPDTFHRAYSMTETADGKTRVFAQDSSDTTDLFEMHLQADGTWSAPSVLDLPRRKTNASPHFSPHNGKFYYVSDFPMDDDQTRTDLNIWVSGLTDEGWTPPMPLAGDVNTSDAEDSLSITSDGTMYFSSARPSGLGGQDIYTAQYDTVSGRWMSAPMPSKINTSRKEGHVAVSPNGRTLYFYSFRQPKLGAVDIVATTRTDIADPESWSEPFNLGPSINTEGIDFGAGFSANGQTFFFSRDGILLQIPAAYLSSITDEAAAAAEQGRQREFLKLPPLD